MKKEITILKKAIFGTLCGLIFLLIVIILMWLFYNLLISLGIKMNISDNNLIFVLTIIATFGIALYIYYISKEDKLNESKFRQKELIKSIKELIEEIEQTARGQIKELNKGYGFVPSYLLPSIDYIKFISETDSKIEEKETWTIKRLIIRINIKIETINNLIGLIHQKVDRYPVFTASPNPSNLINELIKKNEKGEFAYYTDLLNLTGEFIKETTKFL